MKYIISKTSSFGQRNEAPCEGAVAVGCNEFGDTLWGIEINTLEELMALQDKVGHPLIIGPAPYYDANEYSGKAIEIYNDYRE